MSILIENQLLSISTMVVCGMTVAIVYDFFSLLIRRFAQGKQLIASVIRILNYFVMAIIIGEYMLFCQKGKITFSALCSLLFGLWLWRKIFCVRIYPGDKDEQKGKET